MNKQYCQSCGMPLRFDVEEFLGTNIDNSRSDEYCYYCLENGEYIVDIPMSEMIDIWVKYTDKYNEYSATNYTAQELRTVLNKRLPSLRRWKQKQETKSIHYYSIQRICFYINDHLFDNLDMDLLITMSSLSKYHFRKVFKSITGENIASYIQRLQLEQIANMIINTNYTLEQVASQTNYSTKHSLAKAFRKHFGVTTSTYKKVNTKSSNKDIVFLPEIKTITDMQILCLEVGDSYKNRLKYRFKWKRISRFAEQNRLNGKYISVSLDDPLLTPTDKCRFYLGIIAPINMEAQSGFSLLSIKNGRYAVFKHKGDYKLLYKLYKYIYEEWLPQSEYQPRGTISFEVYLNSPKSTKTTDLETEVYISIEKK